MAKNKIIINLEMDDNKNIIIASGKETMTIDFIKKEIIAKDILKILNYKESITYELNPKISDKITKDGEKEYFNEVVDIITKIITEINLLNSQDDNASDNKETLETQEEDTNTITPYI